MALTGEGHQLEKDTPEAKADRIEQTLIMLGKQLDNHSYYIGCEWEERIRELLMIKEK